MKKFMRLKANEKTESLRKQQRISQLQGAHQNIMEFPKE